MSDLAEIEKQYIEKAQRPKQKIRDEKDIKYVEQQRQLKLKKKLQQKQEEDNDEPKKIDPEEFVPDKELIEKKEEYKRKMFAKQAVTLVKIEVKKAVYYQEKDDNNLKWNYIDYKKNTKLKEVESKHMQQAGISFKKKKKNEGDGQEGGDAGDGDQQNQQDPNQNDDQQQEEKLPEIYCQVQYGKLQFDSKPIDTEHTKTEDDQINPNEYQADWTEQVFTFDKVTNTIAYFNIRQKDTLQSYKQRHSWLKEKYDGDFILGKAKLDLAQLVIDKNKESKKDKEIVIKNENGEKIGMLSVSVQYEKPNYDREKLLEKKILFNFEIANVQADFGKADITKLKEKLNSQNGTQFGELIPYAKIRIGKIVQRTADGTGTSVTSTENYKFLAPDDAQKIYIETHLFNQASRFNECVGIGVFYFKDLKPEIGQTADQVISKDCEIPLSYKGKVAGTAKFKITKHPKPTNKEKKIFTGSDMKELSKPSEQELERRKILQMKQEQLQQRFYELNYEQKKDKDQFLTPQPIKKAQQELKLPRIKQNQNSSLQYDPVYQDLSLTSKNIGTILSKNGEPIFNRAPINVSKVIDPKYHNAINGTGFSKWESSATLQRSVPHFSIPREKRFQQYETPVPGPNKYSSIGILEDMQKMDYKLQQRRQKNFEEYKRLAQNQNN